MRLDSANPVLSLDKNTYARNLKYLRRRASRLIQSKMCELFSSYVLIDKYSYYMMTWLDNIDINIL